MATKQDFWLKDQSGAALVIALIMMIVLTLTGLASIFTSTFEIKLSGNKRASTDAFYAAEAGLQSVMADKNKTNFPDNFPESPGTLPADLQLEPIVSKFSSPSFSLPAGVNFTERPQVVIFRLARMGGEGTQGAIWTPYIIESTGRDQIGADLIRSNCQVREKWLRREVGEME